MNSNDGGSITRCEWCGVAFDDAAPPAPPSSTSPARPKGESTEREAQTHCEWCGAPYPQPEHRDPAGTGTDCRVLVVCVHNSARSQIAEELIRRRCGERCHVESAGLEPGILNPFAVMALREIGIDIAGKPTRGVDEVLDGAAEFTTVITVCDETSAERCPAFPGTGARLHWTFPDPSAVDGSDEEKLASAREIRDAIAERVTEWCRDCECCA